MNDNLSRYERQTSWRVRISRFKAGRDVKAVNFRKSRPLAGFALAAISFGSILGYTAISAAPASATTPGPLYAAATAIGTGDCSSAANACSLITALSNVQPGGTIYLVTPGSSSHYFGQFTVNTAGTSATSPITITPAPGVSNPTLDGSGGGTTLTIGFNVSAVISGMTITGGMSSQGGGINNNGSLQVLDSNVSGNAVNGSYAYGGGIYNNGTMAIIDSTIANNTASDTNAFYTRGGGVYNGNKLSMISSSVIDNSVNGGTAQGAAFFTTSNFNYFAGDIFADPSTGPPSAGECSTQGLASITDLGYNVADDSSCSFTSSSSKTSTAANNLGSETTYNSGTGFFPPLVTNAGVGIIPSGTSVNANGTTYTLCPTTDQRGILSATGAPCDAGSVQIANQVISFSTIGSAGTGDTVLLTATGGPSGNPVVFSVPNGSMSVCSVSGTNGDSLSFAGTGTGGTCKVYANQAGALNAFQASTVTANINVTPTAPASPVVQSSPTTTSSSVTLTWSEPTTTSNSPATGFEVFAGTSSGGESTTPSSCSVALCSSSTSCTITGLSPSSKYFFYVEATNSNGTSNSNEVSAITASVPATTTPPLAPVVQATPTTTSSSVTLTWSEPTSSSHSPATGFEVFAGTSSGGESTTPSSCSVALTGASTSCTITGLSPSSNYFFYVKATNSAGSSAPSNEVSAVTTTPPLAPVVQATPTTTSSSVTLTWTEPTSSTSSPATGFEVFAGTSSGGESTTPSSCSVALSSSSTSCTITGLSPSSNYYFYVEATNSAGSSAPSNEVSAVTGASVSSPHLYTGAGYYLTANDGGVFAFGDAPFVGSAANMNLDKPIVGISSTPDGKGYWLVASDGGVFAFGDAPFVGAATSLNLKQPISGV